LRLKARPSLRYHVSQAPSERGLRLGREDFDGDPSRQVIHLLVVRVETVPVARVQGYPDLESVVEQLRGLDVVDPKKPPAVPAAEAAVGEIVANPCAKNVMLSFFAAAHGVRFDDPLADEPLFFVDRSVLDADPSLLLYRFP